MTRRDAVRPVRSRFRPRRPLVLPLVLALGLVGCAGGTALKRSFNDYAEVYADLTNRQLLMNLARMSHTHPPHFLQLGLINTTFQFGANAGVNASNTETTGRIPTTPAGALPGVLPGSFLRLSNALTLGGSAAVALAEQPTFSFTPLSGPEFAKGFLSPVPPAVFFTLSEQGEPIDLLLRILVQSVEYIEPASGKRVTLVNDPTLEDTDVWVRFLRMAAVTAELQRRQLLRVVTTSVTVPTPGPVFDAPTVEQALKAHERGLTFQPVAAQPGKYALATAQPVTSLEVAPEAMAVMSELARQPFYRIMPERVQPPPPGGDADQRWLGLTMRLRSFFEVMQWVSTEQAAFEALAARPGFLESLPPSQRQPVLQLNWDRVTDNVEEPVVAVEFRGRVYAITDRRGHTWNRSVFQLLSYVQSQVALDPKQLPVQQLINVR